jgi:hypothetical protein
MSVFNSTYMAIVLGLTFLCVSPVAKAIYALRCFYGVALTSGADLKKELSSVARAALVIGCCLCGTTGASAQEPAADSRPERHASVLPLPPHRIEPPALNSAIERVMAARKYTWRLPREDSESDVNKQRGNIGRFLLSVRDWFIGITDWLKEQLRKFVGGERPWRGQAGGWGAPAQALLYGLAAAVVIALVIVLARAWQERGRTQIVQSQPLAPALDLANENVGAEQLPEDSWLALATELWERGETRLALRALFLATLAHLAAGHWLALARYKSNRDYERELQRRGQLPEDLFHAFRQNRAVFEEVWYGHRDVDAALIAGFRGNLDRIRSIAGGAA